MPIHVALNHVTHYRYDRWVKLAPQVLRLRPAPHTRSQVLSYAQRIEPAEHFINWQQDPFANYLARVVFPQPMRSFQVTIDLVLEMAVHNPFDFFLEPYAETFPFAYPSDLQTELAPYLEAAPAGPHLQAYLAPTRAQLAGAAARTVDFLVALNQQLQRDIAYTIRLEPGVQTPEQTLGRATGSCRDSAWLLVQMLRQLGLAARFVSGYLIQLKPDVKPTDGPAGAAQDFCDLHAWCEVYLPGAGWIGLDPTSGLLAGEGHIPLACTPQPSSAAPISGALDECEVAFEHQMRLERVHESARVTKPYSEAQWQAIHALGQQVDAELERGDVRLTMGGEPTFVSSSERDAPQWNTTALGPSKRRYALELLQRLRERYGAGGIVHLGQGKWYPGEPLPRWALSLYWRTDAEPIWHNPALLDGEHAPQRCDSADAQRFIAALAQRLGLGLETVQPAYEDSWYHLWREGRLPLNVDPLEARLDDELERARLRRVFRQGLDAVVGYALPLQAQPAAPGSCAASSRWRSGPWFLREQRLYLIPGDSPMGYRLPLDALPWVAASDCPLPTEPDPAQPRPDLPAASALRLRYAQPPLGSAAAPAVAARMPQRGESAAWLVRTALCVEARDPQRGNGCEPDPKEGSAPQSCLYVFMPPLPELEDYLDLLAAVEATAAQLGLPIVLEGYPPPRDARLQMLQVTPDPGVIEVNIHPARHWGELVERTEFLYEAAQQVGLCAEKFLIDGRHTGTGGGNHFVLGAATPLDSPFLRRPELLASLLAYWHNHPSLSYLFSGLFIGPTSQAPRVDEARNDQVYELEIALSQIERSRELYGQQMPPWQVDRCLRNILVDVSGNTHRSAFSIDKLYSPDGPSGRLGLLELRAFEMPPHARMSLVQQLLLRALVARFWQQPGRARLTRWGTQLHDRFLLPTFVRLDFEDVLDDLAQHGFGFERAWFEPHFEFRFPLIGQLAARGMVLTLRHALEPWHVLGEEGSTHGTVRYVDSSVERLEVKLSGYNDSRYALGVNGRALPLHPSGLAGEYVAGVRFKAWNPASSLHPGVGVHAPLTFDIFDTWLGRSVGGCQYHVMHPGGRNHERLPVNAFEAESRRLERFFRMGHTPGTLALQATQPSR
ncbi:MAG: transglutaminase family protein [Pseudomonadota bacterium]|jgi:uncharacterized protein (DUF2126 family)/transglutaminase-like putative cysteine protease